MALYAVFHLTVQSNCDGEPPLYSLIQSEKVEKLGGRFSLSFPYFIRLLTDKHTFSKSKGISLHVWRLCCFFSLLAVNVLMFMTVSLGIILITADSIPPLMCVWSFAPANVIQRMIHRPFVARIKSQNSKFLAPNEASLPAYEREHPWSLNTSHFCVIVHIRVERYCKRSQSTGAKSPAWYAYYGCGREVILITQTGRDGGSMFLLHNSECYCINIQFTIRIRFPNGNPVLPSWREMVWFNITFDCGLL